MDTNVSKNMGVAAALLVFAGLFPVAFSENSLRLNVLFLAVDDWNDMVGAMGCEQVSTPNLDRLAARGTVFLDAHAPGVYCAPSRTAIMTGLQPYNSGCYRDEPSQFNSPDHLDLPQAFKATGYETAGSGKVYHHMPGYLDRRGFDEWFLFDDSMKENGWKIDSWTDKAPLPPQVPFSEIAQYTRWKEFDFYAVPNEQEEQMADSVRASWAVDFLKREHGKPFFLAFGTYAPHKPNYAPQKYFDLYPLENVKLPPFLENDLDDLPDGIRRKLEGRAKRVHDLIREHGDWKRAIQGYMACISYADAMMGRVLDALAQSPYADNTIVVLWSDNGYHLGEKTWWAKHTLWNRTSHVPFIWAGPGIPQGAKPECTVSLIDTYRTLSELCGLSASEKLDGASLVPVFRDPKHDLERTIVVAESADAFAVVNSEWRLIVRPEGEELYNRKTDPNEWINLAMNPEYEGLRAGLRKAIPVSPATEAAGRKNKKVRLILDGEEYRWEAVKKK